MIQAKPPQKAKLIAPKAITLLSSRFDSMKYPTSNNALTKNKYNGLLLKTISDIIVTKTQS